MKSSYNVCLVAGSRPGGKKQFGSTAEVKHNRECRDWLKGKFPAEVKADLAALGSLNIRLTEEEAAELELDPRILYVEKGVPMKPAYFQEAAGWGLARSSGRTDDRFQYTNTGKGVAMYIIDSGVSEIHDDMLGRVTEIYTSEVTDIQDSHGTTVASIAAGTELGVAKDADIFSVRVGDAVFDSTDVIAGMNAILSHHTTQPAVANMSFSSPTYVAGMASAIASMIAEDIICIAAAGNDTVLASLSYPANYTDVICVGAIQEDLDIAPFSNYGPRVDILAPGRFVLAASLTGGIEEASGTSVAAPYVAGTAACAIEGLTGISQSDFLTSMQDQAQTNLSTHTEGTTTKDVILSSMVRVWLGNSGSVADLKALKKYTLKPFTEDIGGGNKIYETEQTVVPVQKLATLKRLGDTVTNQFAMTSTYTKVVPGDNPIPPGTVSGGSGTGGSAPRHIISTLDPTTLLNLSVSIEDSAGTISFTVLTKPAYEVKEPIEIQGLVCQVERIGPNYTGGEKSYKVECRITPEFSNEFVTVNYPNMADGDSHSVHDMIASVATQAGTSITVSVPDLQVQEFSGSGRFPEVLQSLAELICGTLIQQNGAWFIVEKMYAIGDFTVPSGDIQSVVQSEEGDVLDTISGLADDLKSAYIEADALADQIEDLEEDLQDLKDDLDEVEAATEDDENLEGYRDARVFLDNIDFSFGHFGKGNNQMIPEAVKIESIHWDYWTPAIVGDTEDPNNKDVYYRIEAERDSNGELTGRMKGLRDLTGCTLLWPFQKPSNSSGLYFARGQALNIFGAPIVDNTWSSLHWIKRREEIPGGGAVTTYTDKYYFPFSALPERWYTGPIDNTHKYSVNLEVEYVPTVTVKWKFAGTMDFSKWAVMADGKAVGMVNPDGEFWNINGELVTEVTDVLDLPGTVSNFLCILDSNGGLAAYSEGGSFWSIYGEHCGVVSSSNQSLIRIGNNINGKIVGWLDGVFSADNWPGLGGALPQETNPAISGDPATIDKRAIPAYFMTEIPSAQGIDYSGYDPANPGDWTPGDIDPNEEETALNQSIKDLELQIAELKIDATVLAARIACIEKELESYGCGYLITSIKAAADAWTLHRREEERQDEFNAKNLTKMRELHADAVALDQALMVEISNCPARVWKTDCTFIYDNTLPMPRNTLVVPNLAGNTEEEYFNECGVIDSVSLSLGSSGCAVTVSSTKRKE